MNFWLPPVVGALVALFLRYSKAGRPQELKSSLIDAVRADFETQLFESLLLLLMTLLQGGLVGLAFSFLVSSPIPFVDPQPFMAIVPLIALIGVRLNYEFVLVFYRFLKR